MADNLKILVAGDVEGHFEALYKRVDLINKKNGPFDMLLCTGDFFSTDPQAEKDWESYKTGHKKVSVPTFILGPTKQELVRFYPDLKGCELCTNVTYLGDYGIYTGSSGLKLVYVSGKEKSDPNKDIGFSIDSIKAIEIPLLNNTNFTGVDILLTSQWPKEVEKHSQKLEGSDSRKFGSTLLARLAMKIKPRYHFAGCEDIHYERPPYRNHEVLQQAVCHVTRFISLAKVVNTKKLKWLYAFNIAPLNKTPKAKLNEQPVDVTACPYMVDVQADEAEQRKDALANQFFYDVSDNVMTGQGRHGMKRGRGQHDEKNRRRPPPQPMGPCWFCLSSSEVEKHLVVSVGDHCYLALPKGALVPGHVLILPIGHYQSSVDLPEDVAEEAEKFKVAVRKTLQKEGKSVVFFERSFKSPHLQIQCVPISAGQEDAAIELFLQMASEQSINLDELPPHAELRQVIKPGSPYFYLELSKERRYICHIRGRFPLQFGREVLAQRPLLNCPDRVDWKHCPSSREEEMKGTSHFRKLFQPFDFTL